MASIAAALEAVHQNATGPRAVLSVGSGPQELEDWRKQGYYVVRLDIDPSTNPDIVGDMRNLGNIGLFDVVFCCHSLEHLYPHETFMAMKEFLRVLRPGGQVLILVPDLEGVQATEDALYRSECGPISGLHLYYGDPNEIPTHPYMAHHCGFVEETLKRLMELGGFQNVTTQRMPNYNLMGTGVKSAG